MDVGVEFKNYRVIEHIGRGGMADVWSARDKKLSRTVAIKTVGRDLSQDVDPIKLFEREARTIANLEHPHILPIYDFGDYEGQLYIVMRYVSGGSLEGLIERGALSVEDTLRLARAIALALEHAHNNNVIHLDLKPSNVLLDISQSPYLADFGLATMVGPEGRAQNPGSGTLLYMAPEQLTSDHLDRRADIYSFAVLLFHMMTGQLPFDASMPLALMQLQMREPMPELHGVRAGIPPGFTQVLRRASDVEPGKRHSTLKEVIQHLDNVLAFGGSGRGTAFADVSTRPIPKLDALITNQGDGLLSRPIPVPADPEANTRTAPVIDSELLLRRTGESPRVDELISRPVDGLLSRPGDAVPADLLSRKLPPADQPPPERTDTKPGERFTAIKIDLDDITSVKQMTPEQMAQREIDDIYQRARRAWARGQGRFLLGVTDFILIADSYALAEAADLDEQGIETLLRGALEYDHEIEFWWHKLADEDRRRWVALHALRSENAPARVRALEKLAIVKDAEPPQIPRQIAQTLQTEPSPTAQLAALTALQKRAPAPALGWQPFVYSADIDSLIAETALKADSPAVAELAARVIGRIRSTQAVSVLAEYDRLGKPAARRALALVRDEAPSLPGVVGTAGKFYAWWTNTTRRLAAYPGGLIRRFLFAFLGAFVASSTYVWVNLSDAAGSQVVIQEIFERMVGLGLLFGLLFGLTVLLGSEIPNRLRGFWAGWARALVGGAAGMAGMMVSWGLYDYLLLRNPYPDWSVIAWAGVGMAAACAVLALVRLPGIVQMLVTGLGVYLPLFFVWHGYFVDFIPAVSIVYFRTYDGVFSLLIPMVIVMALGACLGVLWQDVRPILRRAGQATRQSTP